HVFGYTVANDVTARDAQRRESQWFRAKAFDTSKPIGPWIVTDLDPADVTVRSAVNGETRQEGSTRDLVFDVPFLISAISEVTTLLPGDVILTGTPEGVGPVEHGDVIDEEIEEIRVLSKPVIRQASAGSMP